jgi:nucleotide sugar dehydrogenase
VTKLAQFKAAVIGLGKIGLPLSVYFAGNGIEVIGCDISPKVVDAVNRGRSPIEEEDGLAERLVEVVEAGRLRATTDTTAAVAECNVVLVIVPVVVGDDYKIDYGSIDAATEAIAAGLKPGTLVIYETTLPVGTTRERLVPALERGASLRIGQDFYVAFSPERVYSGRIFRDLARYPKVVGGVTPECTERAMEFYRVALGGADLLTMENADAAEMVKLMETTYRDVNIALANLFARFAASRGVKVDEAIAAANSQPFSHIHRPGIAVGGHCIPVYPYFLISQEEGGELAFLREARRLNDSMPEWALGPVARSLGGLEGKRVLVLGLAYRENVKETWHSGAVRLIELLSEAGAEPLVDDLHYSREEIAAFGAIPVDAGSVAKCDCVILQAYHDEYRLLDWARLAAAGCRVVLDGRNMLERGVIEAAGMEYIGVGR